MNERSREICSWLATGLVVAAFLAGAFPFLVIAAYGISVTLFDLPEGVIFDFGRFYAAVAAIAFLMIVWAARLSGRAAKKETGSRGQR